jgi:thiol:disulfide interchange protein
MKLLATLLLFVTTHLWALQEDHAKLAVDVLEESESFLALTVQHEKDWHTYWKNPGDAGIATQFKFKLDDKEMSLEPLEWPAPYRYIEAGDILTYGYAGDPTFFFKLPRDLKGNLTITAQWLICKDICIPGGQNAELLFESDSNIVIKSPRSGLSISDLRERINQIPELDAWPEDMEIYLSKNGEKTLRLDYIVKNYPANLINPKRNLLTPFLSPPFGFKRESLGYDKDEKAIVGSFSIDWDGDYQEPQYPLPEDGKFVPPLKIKFLYATAFGETKVIEKTFESFSPTSAGLEENFNRLTPIGEAPIGEIQKAGETQSLSLMFLFAFLGGLILNLMPCVLPVISIKLFGLIKYQAQSKRRILLHNISYSAGVISTFMLLAAILVFIKKSGESVGWGFQLQSPLFVLFMVGLLFIMSLNLFGLFEFVTPGGRVLGNTQQKDGFTGDFFTGVLSTILSTPCSAPFLGTALAFAFTGSTVMIFLMFFFIGLGLAFPFLLTGIFPALISFIPKPGVWMEKLKYFLGLTMLLTVAWLTDVFFNLVDPLIWMWPVLLFFITLFFAFWFRNKISKNWGLNLLFFLLPFALMLNAIKTFELKPTDKTQTLSSENEWTAWSPQMQAAKIGSWVFIDFTAAWCLTCKVNKKLVLDTEAFKKLATEKNIVLLRGDWTQRDDVITNFLKSYNIVGVPAYFIQKPDGEVISLGETISIGKIKDLID